MNSVWRVNPNSTNFTPQKRSEEWKQRWTIDKKKINSIALFLCIYFLYIPFLLLSECRQVAAKLLDKQASKVKLRLVNNEQQQSKQIIEELMTGRNTNKARRYLVRWKVHHMHKSIWTSKTFFKFFIFRIAKILRETNISKQLRSKLETPEYDQIMH